MADTQTQPARRGGGLSKLVLWLLVLGLLAAVWWLASERNLRRFAWRPDESVLTISKGRFFPLGMANIAADDPQLGKVYGPIPIPQGAKVSEQEFDDQTALDRALFDLVVPWARGDAQKGEEKSIAEAGRLVDRASALPGLTAEQHQQLAGLRGELAFTAARQELLQAAKLVLSARRKLQSVEEGGGEHALEAGPLLRELEGIQGLLEDASQSKPHPTPSTPPPTSPPRQPTAPRQRALAPDAGTAAPSVPR
ncbi:MAG TPA: hypothetical protein VF994_15725 [Myxococcales bacterium]